MPAMHAPPRALEGKRIVLTRPVAQAGDFEDRVRALGGDPVLAPAIAIAPPETWSVADAALHRVAMCEYDWIAFTSANAVTALVERADAIDVPRDAFRGRRLAAVGRATAAAVRAALGEPTIVAATHTAESLAREIPDVDGRRVLFPHGDLAADALPAGLAQRGAFVDAVVVYRTVPGDGVAALAAAIRAGTVDAVLFASASAVRFVAEALAEASAHGERTSGEMEAATRGQPRWPAVMCIGPSTADAARAAGLDPDLVAESATQNEMIDRVAGWFAARHDVHVEE
jgi:uroporphyrinogen-III synthase